MRQRRLSFHVEIKPRYKRPNPFDIFAIVEINNDYYLTEQMFLDFLRLAMDENTTYEIAEKFLSEHSEKLIQDIKVQKKHQKVA